MTKRGFKLAAVTDAARAPSGVLNGIRAITTRTADNDRLVITVYSHEDNISPRTTLAVPLDLVLPYIQHENDLFARHLSVKFELVPSSSTSAAIHFFGDGDYVAAAVRDVKTTLGME